MNKSKIIRLKDGRKLGYIEYGNPKGKPVFFFHGWPGSRYSGKETDAQLGFEPNHPITSYSLKMRFEL